MEILITIKDKNNNIKDAYSMDKKEAFRASGSTTSAFSKIIKKGFEVGKITIEVNDSSEKMYITEDYLFPMGDRFNPIIGEDDKGIYLLLNQNKNIKGEKSDG